MTSSDTVPLTHLASTLRVGDIVFTRVLPRAFREVANTTGTWTNHVGIIIDCGDGEPVVAESRFPLSRSTSLSAFVRRSDGGRIAVSRLRMPLNDVQLNHVRKAARRRLNTFYDTGFNLHSRRQFCSRYVREVLAEATGISPGEVQSFGALLRQRPDANLRFWRLWFFGRIPWNRETVSPASVLESPDLQPVFDGYAITEDRRRLRWNMCETTVRRCRGSGNSRERCNGPRPDLPQFRQVHSMTRENPVLSSAVGTAITAAPSGSLQAKPTLSSHRAPDP
jgi:hypothetical protein